LHDEWRQRSTVLESAIDLGPPGSVGSLLAELEAAGVGQSAVDAIEVKPCSGAGLAVQSTRARQPRGSREGDTDQERRAE
jgi:hypothetical protein